jgi:uncharacterized protein YciI
MGISKIVFFALALFLISSGITFSQDEFEMKFGDTTYIMKKYVFGMYKRGSNTDMDTAQLNKLQAAHLNHLSEMSKTGKLLIAGPIEGNNDLRGLLFFNVKDIKEAEELVLQDPAVKAGRLTYELYYWWTAKGSTLK